MIPKEGKVSDAGLPKVRPICLLDETGKTLERVIAERLNYWMDTNPDVGLSENQFGFRKKISTCDAIMKVVYYRECCQWRWNSDSYRYRHRKRF